MKLRFQRLAVPAFLLLAVTWVIPATASARPAAPTGLTAQSPTTSAPSLSWTGIPRADRWQVYRNGGYLTGLPKGSTSFTDRSNLAGGTYTYRVRARVRGVWTRAALVTVVYRSVTGGGGGTGGTGGGSGGGSSGSGGSSGPADLYVTAGGSDSNNCTQSAPCKTFNHAYAVANLGDTVSVSGTLPGQTIDAPRKSGSGVVTFRGPATLTGELNVTSSNHLRFENISRDGDNLTTASDVTVDGGGAQYFFIRSSDHVSYLGGSIGGTHTGISPTVGAEYLSKVPSTYITFDGVHFHDIDRAANPNAHIECLFIQESDYVTLTNSTFDHCEVMDVYVHRIQSGDNPQHMTITNNTFGATVRSGYYTIYFRVDPGESLRNVMVKGNTYGQPVVLSNEGTVQGFTWCDNKSSLVFPFTSAGVSYTC